MTYEADGENRSGLGRFRAVSVPRNPAALAAALLLGVGIGVVTGPAGLLPHVGARGSGVADAGAHYLVICVLVALLAGAVAFAGLSTVRGRQHATMDAKDAALARMSWRLDFALAASEIGVWDVDLKTDQLIWDARARALFGAEDRPGYYSETDWIAVLHPDDRDRAVAAAHAAIDGDGRFVSDYRIVLPGGDVRHIRDMAAVYCGADGSHRLIGLIWDVTPDVTRQKELEMRRAEAEAATLAKSRFLATMSHEIRTPMTGVLGMLDLMLADPLPDRQRERAVVAHASARSLLLLLNDFLDFSKLEAQRVELAKQDVDPRDVVREVVELMAAGAEQKRLTLGWSASAAVPERIVTDPMRLRQILTNLVSNATKFTETGDIRVRLDYAPAAAGGTLEVEVEDTGVGIPHDSLGRLFEEFVQADTSLSRRHGGAGLGLAISKSLVELMAGSITVRSVPCVGSVFAFSIPAPSATAPIPEVAAETSCELRIDPPMRVLVAEDTATNQYLIRAYLESRGHAVTTVDNGAEAVRAVATDAFDVVLMDVQMPELDGRSATRAIRALPTAVSRISIVALTANALPGDREAHLAAGMDDYIAKPIDFNALRAALRRARERTAG